MPPCSGVLDQTYSLILVVEPVHLKLAIRKLRIQISPKD
jgi:hypothetical protein